MLNARVLDCIVWGVSVDIKQDRSTDYHDMMAGLRLEITLTAKYKYAFVTSWSGDALLHIYIEFILKKQTHGNYILILIIKI